MKLLLDTHIFLWAAGATARLDPTVAAALVRPDAELWLSSVSVWEIVVLAEKGRIQLDGSPRQWLSLALRKMPVREIPVDFEVALRSRELSLPHQDPVGRFIAATAAVHGMTLVTADRKLIGADEYGILVHP